MPSELVLTPSSCSEALTDEYSHLWAQAMDKIIWLSGKRGGFRCDLATKRHELSFGIVGVRLETNEIAFTTRAKARLLPRGCGQREGIGLFETYASTPTASCIRLLGVIACELDLDLCHLDEETGLCSIEPRERRFYAAASGLW